jgi:hypothetical protein
MALRLLERGVNDGIFDDDLGHSFARAGNFG